MNTIREEVRDFVSVFERIHKALQADQFSHDEKELVVMCASELITSITATGSHLRAVP